MSKIILVRHGESTSNHDNVFTGWNDVSLTKKGILQATAAGNRIKNSKIELSEIHTSLLTRAIKTAYIIADVIEQGYLPIYKNWRLNERHYGALKGFNKDEVRQIYGIKQVESWRRNFDAVPPLLHGSSADRRYNNIPKDIIPKGESLAMALNRILVYYEDQMVPKLRKGRNLLLVAHGSTIRVLIKYFDQITGEELDGLKVENGEPILYEFDKNLEILKKANL